jgi:hypothetical protein
MSNRVTNFIRDHAATTVMGLLISGCILFFTLRVQAIGDERYVNKEQFATFLSNNAELNAQVMKYIEHEFTDERESRAELREEIKMLRQELRDRRPPPRMQSPKDSDVP